MLLRAEFFYDCSCLPRLFRLAYGVMVKKITVLFSVLAFASASSVALACDTSCKGKDKKGDTDTELSSGSSFDVSGSGCKDSCKKDKDDAQS